MLSLAQQAIPTETQDHLKIAKQEIRIYAYDHYMNRTDNLSIINSFLTESDLISQFSELT